MAPPLYIPKSITVGFQQRSDTYTGKLAYIIYTDHTGKLRKEASWQSWRDKKIDSVTVDNTPQSNFTLNKGVQRSREWFGSGRSMVRVYDQRDFEFEITVDNLLNVLAHADVSKRDITEPCVYAWSGTNLILLPTNSLEYQESLKHTAKQSLKVSAKDLVVGHSYMIKADANTTVCYLGRFPRYEIETVYNNESYRRLPVRVEQKQKKSKYHVFMNVATKEILPKDPSAYLAGVVEESVHSQYADFMDEYYKKVESQDVAGVCLSPDNADSSYYRDWFWHQLNETDYVLFHAEETQSRYNSTLDTHSFRATIQKFARWDPTTSSVQMSHDAETSGGYGYYIQNHPARNLSGLSKTDPALIELGKQIAAIYTAAYQQFGREYLAANPSIPNYWSGRHEAEQAGAKAVREQLNISNSLAWVLADGKVASDHQIRT